MVSPLKEIDKIIKLINQMIELYILELEHLVSNNINARHRSATTVDFLKPKIRDITTFFIKKFCNINSIARNQTRLLMLKRTVESVRNHMWLPLPKKYAKLLRVSMDKKDREIYDE